MSSITAQKELDDLVLLDEINEDTVSRTIGDRLKNGEMYTSIGNVLIATNPFKLLAKNGKSIYDPTVIDSYNGRTWVEMPPHVFGVANDAYSSLLRYRESQSVIVSGESGAGKTESCRQILAFLAHVSSATGGRSLSREAASQANLVRDRLITSNTVLEAFGNAKTVRNDNSSRFGKLMECFFTPSGRLNSGAVNIYLLEKHRVTAQAPEERNFHVLHQLTAGAPSDLRRSLHIETADNYTYMSDESRTIAGVNDAANFKGLGECLRILGVDAPMQREMWSVLAAVLNLGNIDFTSEDKESARDAAEEAADAPASARTLTTARTADSSLNGHAARVDTDARSASALEAAASLLGVSNDALEAALVHRTISVRGEETRALQNPSEARGARDSLAKALYEALFSHLVRTINASIAAAAAASASSSNQNLAKSPAAENTSEPATSPAPNTPDSTSSNPKDVGTPKKNEPTPNAKKNNSKEHPKKKSGTATPAALPPPDLGSGASSEQERLSIAILDIYGFEALESNGFDQLCINYVNEKLQQLFIDATLQAEQAEYEAEGIKWEPIPYFDNAVVIKLIEGVGKGQGVFPLLDDACAMSETTSDPNKLLDNMSKAFANHEHFISPKVRNGQFTIVHYAGDVTYQCEDLAAANRDSLNRDLLTLMAEAAKKSTLIKDMFPEKKAKKEVDHKRPPTASFQFKLSVHALVDTLSMTMPHYIRCLKPNDQKKALTVNEERLTHQVRYLGLVANVGVKRAGFAYRCDYEGFLNRYRILSSVSYPAKEGEDARAMVEKLLTSIKVFERPMVQQRPSALPAPGAIPGAAPGAAPGAVPGAPNPNAAGGALGARGLAGATRGMLGRPLGRPLGAPPRPGAAAQKAVPKAVEVARRAVAALNTSNTGSGGAAPTAAATIAIINELAAKNLRPGDLHPASSYQLVQGQDFQFGASKVFIKLPRHLFALEHMRSLALGTMASRVAAKWRAYAGRRQYLKMRASFLRAQAIVRAYLAHKRFLKMKANSVRIQALIRGHLARERDDVKEVREGLGLVSWKGKPRRAMSLRWERPPGNDWLGLTQNGMVSQRGLKANETIVSLKSNGAQESVKDVKYADNVLKVRGNYSLAKRALVLTASKLIAFADPIEKGKLKRCISITDIEKVNISPFTDGYVCFSVRNSYAYLCVCQSKVALVRSLEEAARALNYTIPIEVTTSWTYRTSMKENPDCRTISLSTSREATPFEQRVQNPSEAERKLAKASNGASFYNTGGDISGTLSTPPMQGCERAAERKEPFQPILDMGADGRSISVLVYEPPRKSTITPAEMAKIQAKGLVIKKKKGRN